MSPADERTQILRSFARLGPKIERVETERSELFEEQNDLIARGNAAGLSAVEMARARVPNGEIKYVAESFRQVLRRNKKAKEQKATTRKVASKATTTRKIAAKKAK